MRQTVYAAILAFALLPGIAPACPNCKSSIPNSDAQQAADLPSGFNNSIYFMLGGVLVVAGLVVRMVVKETRS